MIFERILQTFAAVLTILVAFADESLLVKVGLPTEIPTAYFAILCLVFILALYISVRQARNLPYTDQREEVKRLNKLVKELKLKAPKESIPHEHDVELPQDQILLKNMKVKVFAIFDGSSKSLDKIVNLVGIDKSDTGTYDLLLRAIGELVEEGKIEGFASSYRRVA